MAEVLKPATAPGKKRKKWRVPSLKKGFAPDLLDGMWKPLTSKAEAMEQALLKHIAKGALGGVSGKSKTLTGLRTIIGRGLHLLGKAGGTVERDATAIGKKTAREMLATLDPDKVAKAIAGSPKMPRNIDTGTTVRTPASLAKTFKDMAPTLMGTGSLLFDEVVHALAMDPPESDAARRRVAQKVIDRWKDRGVTGFVDKSGRRWNMVSYVEMATRTAASNLAMKAHISEVMAAGLDVVRVTVMPNCHPFCQPFQGRLLSITGKTVGEYDGEDVVASLDHARLEGFMHPNCRHSVRVHIPGMAIPDPDLIDPGDYEASQQLRALEREVRKARRMEESAVSPEGLTVARQAVRRAHAGVRAHVDATGVVRNRWREQVKQAL